jgi:ABC-2 type transport system permease protein
MKYIKLVWAFFRASFAADIEYRVNYFVRIITEIFYYISQITVFEVLFIHTESLGGWSIHHARVFLGVLLVVDSTYMILFSENLDRFSDKVRRGDLDLLLAKPVNSQFMMSFGKIATTFLTNWLITFAWLVWAIGTFPGGVPAGRLAWLLLLMPCGVVIMYSNRFLFSITALILTRSENLQHLWYQIHKLGTRPDSLYPNWLRYLVLTFLPVGFIASVPARAILDTPDLSLISWTLVMSLGFILLTSRLWKLALRHYSSASS